MRSNSRALQRLSPAELVDARKIAADAAARSNARPIARKRAADRHLREKYGIGQEDYDRMLAAQGHACAVCRREDQGSHPVLVGLDAHGIRGKRWMVVDHDHKTGRVRGLLCNDCNLAIGRLGDNAEGVRRALDYLEGRHPWVG